MTKTSTCKQTNGKVNCTSGKHSLNTIQMKFKQYLFDKFQTTIKGSVNINILLVCGMPASTLNHLPYLPGNVWIAGRRESPLPLTWDGCMCLSIVTCPRLIVDMRWPKLPSPCSLIKTWAQGLGGFTRLYTRWSLLFAPQIKATPYDKYEGTSGDDGTKHLGTTDKAAEGPET